jgi:DNA-directed RNA polymerase II subunit RPB3
MNPQISQIEEDGDVYKFTLSDIDVSIANALRRTILSEIPINAILTETHEENQCTISINTTRLHNEILKQRLSSIPICMKDLDLLPGKYVLEVDVINETENILFITSGDFRIKNKENGNYLTKTETEKIFPANALTHYHIDFARLRPNISDSIPGEQLKLSAEFSISNAKHNSMFNVVSKCAYGNTPDKVKISEAWEVMKTKLETEGAPAEDIAFQKKNYMLLDAQRQFVPNSFDFTIQTLGIYENKELVQKACAIMQNKFVDMLQWLEADTQLILNSETTIDNCYDIILENEDYTIGKVLEYILYERFYLGDKSLSFCGFKKFHPHNKESTIRLAFNTSTDRSMIKHVLTLACIDAQAVFKKMFEM